MFILHTNTPKRALSWLEYALLLTASACASLGAQASSFNYTPQAGVEIQWQIRLPHTKLHVFKALPHYYSTSAVAAALAISGLNTNDIASNPTNGPKGFLWFHRRSDTQGVGDGRPNEGLIIDSGRGIVSFVPYLPEAHPPRDIPDDNTVARLAWQYMSQLGIDRAQLAEFAKTSRKCEPASGPILKTEVCARGIVLTRLADGIEFDAGRGFVTSGFVLDVQSHARIKEFQLIWPDLQIVKSCSLPSRRQVEHFIRQGKTFLVPAEDTKDETTYNRTMAELNAAPRVTVSSVKPCYARTSAHSDTVAPILKLEVKTATAAAYLLCPVNIDMP